MHVLAATAYDTAEIGSLVKSTLSDLAVRGSRPAESAVDCKVL